MLVGQVLGYAVTARRDRRADLAHAVDRAVSAFADGETALDDVTSAIQRWQAGSGMRAEDDDCLAAALAQAERTRVQMRAAVFSLRVRVRDEHVPLHRTFDRSWDEWEIGYEKARAILRDRDPARDALREIRGHASEFRGLFYDQALEEAARVAGKAGNRIPARRPRDAARPQKAATRACANHLAPP